MRTLAAASSLALAACASPDTHSGLALGHGAGDPQIEALAQRAQQGDKHAQLQLGILFEEGRGVPADARRAERLYRAAASTSKKVDYVYVPPAGTVPGQVLRLPRGPASPGLAEARDRLERLRARRARAPKRANPQAGGGEDASI